MTAARGGDLVDVRYGEETRFLDVGSTYVVGVARSAEDGLLVSTVREPAPLFGGDAVVGLDDTDVDCPQLPDPVLTFGINDLPVSGRDRFSLTRDSDTQRSIGVMQEVTRGDKRLARTERAQREVEAARIAQQATLADLQRGKEHYAEAVAAYDTAISATLDALKRRPFGTLLTALVIGITLALPAGLYAVLGGWPLWLGFLLAMLGSGLLSVLIEITAFRRLRKSGEAEFGAIISTLGADLIIMTFAQKISTCLVNPRACHETGQGGRSGPHGRHRRQGCGRHEEQHRPPDQGVEAAGRRAGLGDVLEQDGHLAPLRRLEPERRQFEVALGRD